jgi:hypothetical protein
VKHRIVWILRNVRKTNPVLATDSSFIGIWVSETRHREVTPKVDVNLQAVTKKSVPVSKE